MFCVYKTVIIHYFFYSHHVGGPKHDGKRHRQELSQMLSEVDRKSEDSGIEDTDSHLRGGDHDAIELLGES